MRTPFSPWPAESETTPAKRAVAASALAAHSSRAASPEEAAARDGERAMRRWRFLMTKRSPAQQPGGRTPSHPVAGNLL